jgi:hypothetical protein
MIKISALTLGVGILALASSPVLAQVYSEDFATESSLTGSYLSIETSTTASGYTFNSDSSLELTDTTAAGRADDIAASFTGVTLSSVGQSITLTATFNSPNIATTAGSSGALLFALDNSEGAPITSTVASAGPEGESSTSAGGATSGFEGQLGDIALNSTPKTSTKFYERPATGLNGLSYYSDAGTSASSPATQDGTSFTGNPALADNTTYTLTYTISYASATSDNITAQITGGTLTGSQDDFSVAATSVPTQTFDTFDLGLYNGAISGASGYDINLTDVEITDIVPEPSVLAFGSAGLGLLGLIRFRRRS